MKKVRSPIAEISFNAKQRIVHIVIIQGAEMTLENTKSHYELINQLVMHQKYLALIDASNFYSIEPEAWKFASQKEVVGNRVATANYNVSLPNKLVTNSYKVRFGTAMPLELFNSKIEAERWLMSFNVEKKNFNKDEKV